MVGDGETQKAQLERRGSRRGRSWLHRDGGSVGWKGMRRDDQWKSEAIHMRRERKARLDRARRWTTPRKVSYELHRAAVTTSHVWMQRIVT